ncbi:MAG: hypothetical protein JO212_10125, partial [Acetobacteraceae bacterium]|nr:hypothetical protein [Acetobacteraceae bacterium]
LGELVRHGEEQALDGLAEEIVDRFGPIPEPVENLLALARLRIRCRRLGIAKLEAGPFAAAATFRGAVPPTRPPLEAKDRRLILRRAAVGDAGVLATAEALVAQLLSGRRRVGASWLELKQAG